MSSYVKRTPTPGKTFAEMTRGERLLAARLWAGLSQQELSERTGIKRPGISNYEKDRVVPRIDKIQRLGAALDVSCEWIETGKDARDCSVTIPVSMSDEDWVRLDALAKRSGRTVAEEAYALMLIGIRAAEEKPQRVGKNVATSA